MNALVAVVGLALLLIGFGVYAIRLSGRQMPRDDERAS